MKVVGGVRFMTVGLYKNTHLLFNLIIRQDPKAKFIYIKETVRVVAMRKQRNML